MRFTVKQLLIAVAFFGISFAAFAFSFGFNSARPISDATAKATFIISGMAFGAAIGSLTRRPIRFGIIGLFVGPAVFFIALFGLGYAYVACLTTIHGLSACRTIVE